jgi:hypothetical protein
MRVICGVRAMPSVRFFVQAYDVVCCAGPQGLHHKPQPLNPALQLGDDPATYYVVGTAVVRPEDTEPSKGRILVLKFEEGKVR